MRTINLQEEDSKMDSEWKIINIFNDLMYNL